MRRGGGLATVLLVSVLIVGMIAPVAGLGDSGASIADHGVDIDTDDVEIDSDLERAEGEVKVVVKFTDADTSTVQAAGARALQDHASATQTDVVSFAGERDGVTLLNQFWVTNAIVLTVDTDEVDIREIAALEHVERLQSSFTVQLPDEPATHSTSTPDIASSTSTVDTTSSTSTVDTASSTSTVDTASSTSDWATTYGLAQINAPAAWEQFGTMGQGARVAVLDTGVDADHPDIDLYTDDPDDPTHPGGWAELDEDGNVVEGSEPHDSGSHGTHVSGTVAGGDASGEHIGVAPDVHLMHGLVLEGGSGTYAQIIGGMEWAVQNDADVISMSMGADMYADQFIDPIQNTEAAGTVVVSASGNDGEGTSGSPGNLYDGLAVGATNENEDVTSFSSGEEIVTEDAWGDAAPEHWPDEYIVPDLVAPGNNVKSTVPGDDYDEQTGTSMATPHVSGVVALMVSANPDLQPHEIEQVLIGSAWKPDGEPEEQDTRYGHGIVDAEEAVAQVALDTGVNGTVVSDGEPVEDAVVELDDRWTTTDANGEFQLLADPGTYTLMVSGDGIESTTQSVTVEDTDELTDVGVIHADPALHLEIVEDQPEVVAAGDDVETVLEGKHVDSISVNLSGDYEQSDATLVLDGQEADFDTVYEFDDYTGDITVAVETDADATGEFNLDVTASGMSDEQSVTTGSTQVLAELIEIGLVGNANLEDVESTLDDELPSAYHFSTVSSAAEAADHDVLVVQSLGPVDAEEFVAATTDSDTGVVYLDQWGEDSNGIPDYAEVTDSVADTFQDDGFMGDVEAPISYEATADHEILAGIEVGEEVLIHESQYADVTWFDGTTFDVIATVHDANEEIGSAMAVDDESATVLASSLGYTEYVNDDEYTETADEILGNAVQYVTPTDEEADDGGVFAVDDVDAPPTAEPGEDVQVLGTVSNVGNETGTSTVTAEIGDGAAASQNVTLDAGDWESLAFSLTVPAETGTYNVTVSTADDTLTETLTVEDPAETVVLDVESAQTVPGGSAHVQVTAEGEGIAGYEAMIGFDPDVVQVASVDGEDFVDPEVNVDSENGLVKIAQAQETGEDDPALATITFDVLVGGMLSTELPVFEDETQLNDEQGNVFDLEVDEGDISVACSQLGDVNGDGDVTAVDATLTQRHIVGLPIDGTFKEECADVTQDGEVHSGDIVEILQEVVEF